MATELVQGLVKEPHRREWKGELKLNSELTGAAGLFLHSTLDTDG